MCLPPGLQIQKCLPCSLVAFSAVSVPTLRILISADFKGFLSASLITPYILQLLSGVGVVTGMSVGVGVVCGVEDGVGVCVAVGVCLGVVVTTTVGPPVSASAQAFV